MGKIIVSENVTLDGVIQDPAGDEGFKHGGWVGLISNSPQLGQLVLDEALGQEAFLLGRRTYEWLAARWPSRHGELADRLPRWRGFGEARRPIRLGAMMPDPRSGERALRSKFMLIFRGGAVTRHDLSPSELQAHVEKWYRWSDELARQGRGNVATALGNPGAAVRGHERVVTDGPYAESKDLVTGSLIIEAASLEDAVDVARTCPTYEFGGSVEVRPVQDHRI